jgi:MSHA pilin protein MshA
MKNLNFKRNAGFTLVELVIVIVIVGILAAVALPRFIDIQRDARIAKVNALFGSVRVASSLAKVRCELDLSQGLTAVGTCGNATPQVNMDGTSIPIVNRYPAATAVGVVAAAGITASDGVTSTVAAGVVTIAVNGAPTPASCSISYTAAAVNAAPVIATTTTAC